MFPTLDDLVRTLPDVPEVHRFLEKITVGEVPAHNPELGPCLIWKRARTTEGYGTFKGGALISSTGARQVNSHIWLWMVQFGPVPAGHQLDHLCHEAEFCKVPSRECPHRPCVLHTYATLPIKNTMRSNNFVAINAAKTHCTGKYAPRTAEGILIGHDLSDPNNLYIAPDGRRQCIPCRTEADRRWKDRKRLLHAQARPLVLANA